MKLLVYSVWEGFLKSKNLKATAKAFAHASLLSESLFFACAKKSNQKKAHPAFAPRPASGIFLQDIPVL